MSKVLKVMYSSERDSCVAEVMQAHGADADFSVDDLLSGDSQVVFHHNILNSAENVPKLFSDYDAQFASFAHNPNYKPSRLN